MEDSKKSHLNTTLHILLSHAEFLPMGNTTTRMAIANGTCVIFCNQPKAHFGHPGYAPGTIAVNVTWMKTEFNACQTHRSMYPSIFNRFQVIQPVSSNVRHFSTFHFLHILASPGYAPGTIAVNVHGWKEDSMLVKRIAVYTHLSSTVYEL